MVSTAIVAHEMNRPDVLRNLTLQLVQKGDEFLLPLACITLSEDLAGTGVKGDNEIAGPGTLVRMLMPVGKVLRLSWQGRDPTRTWRQGGLLLHRPPHLLRAERPCLEVDERRDGGRDGGIPRLCGREPDMMAPGFQVMRGQNPAHGGGGDVLHEALRDALACQFFAIPRREATAQRVGTFAGQTPHGPRDVGGKHCPWPRGQGRRRGHPGAGPETAWPTCGRRCVARGPTVPPGSGSSRRPR